MSRSCPVCDDGPGVPCHLCHPDPVRWPFTSVILSTLDKHEAAARAKAPTLLWAYSASLDRHEQAIMAMVEHRWLGHPVAL